MRRATSVHPDIHLHDAISIHALLAESDGTKKFKMPVPAYFYPRSPCGERHLNEQEMKCKLLISIHALLAESDIRNAEAVSKYMIFLSTLSLRRATILSLKKIYKEQNFYPRSPCGERLGLPVAGRIARRISIHALLAESDKLMI